MSVQQTTISVPNRTVRYVYLITILLLTLSGFGQMPIFKRYYIADIPGLGWLAHFYVTHYIHYLAAILFLALAAYMIVDYLIPQKKHLRLTASGYVRGAILAGILISGLLLGNYPHHNTRLAGGDGAALGQGGSRHWLTV